MKTLIDCAVDPLSMQSWGLDAEVSHREYNGQKWTEVTLEIGPKLVYISIRGHHFKARKFKPR